MNLEVDFDNDICVIRYGEYMGFVHKAVGEAIEKLVIENRQLKQNLGG